MSRELICSVLGVPVDSWPPDHYSLIGLTPEQADTPRVEARVQELSARLRPYQLAHPDDVTDALNRLAQALVCLSDPMARADYDKSRSTARHPLAEPMRLADPSPAPPAPRLLESTPETISDARSSARRSVHRRLVFLRRLRTSWLEIGRWFGEPGVKPANLTEAVELIRAAWSLRDLSKDESAAAILPTGRPGARVVALVREPHVLRIFRRLRSAQRSDLAADWRAGLTAVDGELRLLRDQVRRHRSIPRRLVKTARFLVTDGLDITLFALGLIAIGIALARSRN